MLRQILSALVLFTAIFACLTPCGAEITVSPSGIAVRVEEGGQLNSNMTLVNSLGEPVVYSLKITEIEEENQQLLAGRSFDDRSPIRDRRGEPDDAGYFWVDNAEEDGPEYQWEDIVGRQGAQRLNLADNGNIELELGFEFPWYGEWYETIRVCTNGWFALGSDEDGVDSNIPQCPNQNRPNNIVAVEAHDIQIANQSSMYYWTDGEGNAVVSWIAMIMPIAPIRQSLTFQAVLDAETGTVKLQYGLTQGLQVNLINVGYENQDGTLGANILFHQAGIAEGLAIAITGPYSKWVDIEPRTGEIAANGEAELDVVFNPEEMEPGTYEAILGVTGIARADQDDADTSFAEVSIVMTVEHSTYDIAGSVVEEAGGDPIPGASVRLESYSITRYTDNDGQFVFTDLPAGVYRLIASASDFLPATQEVEIDAGNIEPVIRLVQADLILNPDQVSEDIAPEGERNLRIVGSNTGNGPLTYRTERRLIGDANAAPWQVRRQFAVAEILEDDRIEGVAFDGERFYYAGANGDDPNMIYITDRDGQPEGTFVQPGNSRYGMKDIEWDGTRLWGSGEQRVFGFDTEGNVEIQFAAPFNPINNIAYDSDREVLWISGTTTNIVGYTRDGEATGVTLNRRGLRMYGLAYYPNDPDGFPLYIVNSPEANVTVIHKMNPENGDTLRVRNLDLAEGAAPSGLFITNTYDIYSWVVMVTNNLPPADGGDQNIIFQLDAYKNWFAIEPAQGVIEADEEQVFELSLNAVGLPPAEFEGEIVFLHDGVGGETVLPVELTVVGGPVHAERIISLNNGWNLVSSNVDPDDPAIIPLMAPIVEQDWLQMMKDGSGRFYFPALNFNSIPGWNVAEGYLVKVNQACELTIGGMSVMPDQPIPLTAGWHMVSYYPRDPVDAISAFAGIADHLLIAKDGLGRFYLPSRNFSNMGTLREGWGYQVRVDADVELVYQAGERRGNLAAVVRQAKRSHYAAPTPTGCNMSLLIAGISGVTLSAGDQITAMSLSGEIAGAGAVTGGMIGLAVWGDDPTTEAVDGLLENEPFVLKLWSADWGAEIDLSINDGTEGNELRYTTDDFEVIEVSSPNNAPSDFRLEPPFPNPFNSSVTIAFSTQIPPSTSGQIPPSIEGGRGGLSLKIYDLSGRLVADLSPNGSGELIRRYGSQKVVWNAGSVGAGIYFVRLEAGAEFKTQKIVLIR